MVQAPRPGHPDAPRSRRPRPLKRRCRPPSEVTASKTRPAKATDVRVFSLVDLPGDGGVPGEREAGPHRNQHWRETSRGSPKSPMRRIRPLWLSSTRTSPPRGSVPSKSLPSPRNGFDGQPVADTGFSFVAEMGPRRGASANRGPELMKGSPPSGSTGERAPWSSGCRRCVRRAGWGNSGEAILRVPARVPLPQRRGRPPFTARACWRDHWHSARCSVFMADGSTPALDSLKQRRWPTSWHVVSARVGRVRRKEGRWWVMVERAFAP